LSLSSGQSVGSKVENLIDLLDSLKLNVLTDHTDQLWTYIKQLQLNKKDKVRIDIILDNCAIELASDLILCDFLLCHGLVDEIYLYGKAYAWFVSDVIKSDIDLLLEQLNKAPSTCVNAFHSRLRSYILDKRIKIDTDNEFWTTPYCFNKMAQVSPDLFEDICSNSDLVISKGDLNYRKLLGDLNWHYETPLVNAIGSFKPKALCALRTLKSDLVVNLDIEKAKAILKDEYNAKKWMVSGDYGIVQFLIN
jgi:damage-control phosphatase, subfamily III